MMDPKVNAVDANTNLLTFLTVSTTELSSTNIPTNSTLVNLCNADRVVNIITLYMAYFLGIDTNNLINNYVYDSRLTFKYPLGINTQIPRSLKNYPSIEQAFWTIVNQVGSLIST